MNGKVFIAFKEFVLNAQLSISNFSFYFFLFLVKYEILFIQRKKVQSSKNGIKKSFKFVIAFQVKIISQESKNVFQLFGKTQKKE